MIQLRIATCIGCVQAKSQHNYFWRFSYATSQTIIETSNTLILFLAKKERKKNV